MDADVEAMLRRWSPWLRRAAASSASRIAGDCAPDEEAGNPLSGALTPGSIAIAGTERHEDG
jgi:hypothetical protein